MNKKEEVLDLQLTQFGKHLLSKGQLMPVYYAFYDNNVIYDSDYAGIVEEQNDAQGRIQTTPQRATQHVFTSLEKQVKELTSLIRSKKATIRDNQIQNYQDRDYALPNPIGTSALNSSKAPAWNINFLKGEFDSSEPIISGAQEPVKISQINVSPVVYKTQVFKEQKESFPPTTIGQPVGIKPESQIIPGESANSNLADIQFPDGSYVGVSEEYLLISIDEENTEFDNDNIELEVFLVEDVDEKGNTIPKSQIGITPTKEKLYPLSFVKKKSNIENGILLDTEDTVPNLDLELDPSYVEYWFDIFTDQEVDRDVICASRPTNETSGGIFSHDDYNCPDNIPVPNMRLKQRTENDATQSSGTDSGDDC